MNSIQNNTLLSIVNEVNENDEENKDPSKFLRRPSGEFERLSVSSNHSQDNVGIQNLSQVTNQEQNEITNVQSNYPSDNSLSVSNSEKE